MTFDRRPFAVIGFHSGNHAQDGTYAVPESLRLETSKGFANVTDTIRRFLELGYRRIVLLQPNGHPANQKYVTGRLATTMSTARLSAMLDIPTHFKSEYPDAWFYVFGSAFVDLSAPAGSHAMNPALMAPMDLTRPQHADYFDLEYGPFIRAGFKGKLVDSAGARDLKQADPKAYIRNFWACRAHRFDLVGEAAPVVTMGDEDFYDYGLLAQAPWSTDDGLRYAKSRSQPVAGKNLKTCVHWFAKRENTMDDVRAMVRLGHVAGYHGPVDTPGGLEMARAIVGMAG